MSGRGRNYFFDTHRTCQKPIESCCKLLGSGSSLLEQWLRVGGKDPEATVTKQEYWRSAGASNPKRSRLKGYSYGTASRIALCQSPQLVSLPGNCLIASPLSIRRTVIFRFLCSTRRKFSMQSGGKRAGSGWLGMSVAAQTRRRPIRYNPRCLHTARRVAPSSGGHVVFCNGALGVKSLANAAGLGVLFVVDVTPPLHAIRQTERANLGCTWSRLRSAQHPHVRLYSIQRPCDGTSLSKSCRPSVIPPGPIGIRRRPQPASCASENRCRQPTCDAAPPPVCEPARPSPASSRAASRRAAPMPLMSRTVSLGSA